MAQEYPATTTVTTTNTCSRCLATLQRDGSKYTCPPQWTEMKISFRGEPSDYHYYLLCPSCTQELEEFMATPTRRSTGTIAKKVLRRTPSMMDEVIGVLKSHT